MPKPGWECNTPLHPCAMYSDAPFKYDDLYIIIYIKDKVMHIKMSRQVGIIQQNKGMKVGKQSGYAENRQEKSG